MEYKYPQNPRKRSMKPNKYWLIAFIGDSTTTTNTVEILRKGFKEYCVPDVVVTDNGTQFVAVNSKKPYNHIFARFLRENNVMHIWGRPSYPQTNR